MERYNENLKEIVYKLKDVNSDLKCANLYEEMSEEVYDAIDIIQTIKHVIMLDDNEHESIYDSLTKEVEACECVVDEILQKAEEKEQEEIVEKIEIIRNLIDDLQAGVEMMNCDPNPYGDWLYDNSDWL